MPSAVIHAKAEAFYGVRVKIPRCMDWEATMEALLVDDADKNQNLLVTQDDDCGDEDLDWIQEEGETKFPNAAAPFLDRLLGPGHGLMFRLRAGGNIADLDDDEFHDHMALYLIHKSSSSEDEEDCFTERTKDAYMKTNLKCGLYSRRLEAEPEGAENMILKAVKQVGLELQDKPGWYFCSATSSHVD